MYFPTETISIKISNKFSVIDAELFIRKKKLVLAECSDETFLQVVGKQLKDAIHKTYDSHKSHVFMDELVFSVAKEVKNCSVRIMGARCGDLAEYVVSENQICYSNHMVQHCGTIFPIHFEQIGEGSFYGTIFGTRVLNFTFKSKNLEVMQTQINEIFACVAKSIKGEGSYAGAVFDVLILNIAEYTAENRIFYLLRGGVGGHPTHSRDSKYSLELQFKEDFGALALISPQRKLYAKLESSDPMFTSKDRLEARKQGKVFADIYIHRDSFEYKKCQRGNKIIEFADFHFRKGAPMLHHTSHTFTDNHSKLPFSPLIPAPNALSRDAKRFLGITNFCDSYNGLKCFKDGCKICPKDIFIATYELNDLRKLVQNQFYLIKTEPI